MGERSYLSIGDVLALLREEFPDITISKIRFLESRGLLVPERTPSGYRKFYDHDVERLRWILRQQREHFLPLKVIKGRLEGAESAAQPESLFDPAETPPADVSHSPRVGLSAVGSSVPTNGTHPSAGARVVAEAEADVETAAEAQAAAGARVATMAPVRQHQAVTDLRTRREAVAGHAVAGPGADHVPTLDDEHGARPDSGQGDPLSRAAVAVGGGTGHDDPPARQGAPSTPGPRASSTTPPDRDSGAPAIEVPAAPSPTAASPDPDPASTTAAPDPRDVTAASRTPEPAPGAGGAAPAGRAATGSASVSATAAAAAAGTSLVDAVLSGASLTVAELAQASGLRVDQVEELESFGLIEGRDVAGVHCFDEEALVLASLAAAFGRYGIEARHLRIFKHAAERQSSLYSQVVMPLLRQRNPAARARAQEDLQKMAELGTSLQACFSRSVLRDLTGG